MIINCRTCKQTCSKSPSYEEQQLLYDLKIYATSFNAAVLCNINLPRETKWNEKYITRIRVSNIYIIYIRNTGIL